MTIFLTKIAMHVNIITFVFFSSISIRNISWRRGFGTLVLLVVVARMFLLGIIEFIFLLGQYGLVGCTKRADQSKLQKRMFLSNQSIKKILKRWILVRTPYSFSGGIKVYTNTQYTLPILEIII
jgi:hypothetical protein